MYPIVYNTQAQYGNRTHSLVAESRVTHNRLRQRPVEVFMYILVTFIFDVNLVTKLFQTNPRLYDNLQKNHGKSISTTSL